MAEVRISVEFEGLDRVKEAVRRIQDAIEPPSLPESLGAGADVFVESMRAMAPRRTGRLASSIDKHRDGDGWTITGNTVYNNIQNKGGVNIPRNGPFMHFQIDGRWIMAREVHIPATHYVQRAFDAGVGPAAEAAKAEINRKIEG